MTTLQIPTYVETCNVVVRKFPWWWLVYVSTYVNKIPLVVTCSCHHQNTIVLSKLPPRRYCSKQVTTTTISF